MIACLVYVAAILVSNNELEVSKFSFLAAMMLAYQPVRSLATVNMTIQQGLSGAKEFCLLLMKNLKLKIMKMLKN